jgi:hypothetical protein
MERIFIYAAFGFFLFLILNCLLSTTSTSTFRILEGAESKGDKDNDQPAVKCPESCTEVKELQKKLSDSIKTVQSLEQKIEANTQTSRTHASSIKDINESLKEMEKEK